MNIQPRNDLVLIERLEAATRSGLIIIPDIAQEKNMLGKIIAVGPGKLVEGINGGMVRRPIEAKVGEIWYFNSKWNDLSPTHYAEDQLSDRSLHLVMEADLLLRDNNERSGAAVHRGRATAGPDSGNGKAHQKRKATKKDSHGRSARHAATGL